MRCHVISSCSTSFPVYLILWHLVLIWNICQCLTLWKQTCYVSLVCLGAARKKCKTEKDKKLKKKDAFYFCLFVCFSAFVVCIFSDEDQGRSTFQEETYLFTCHECKTNIIYKYIYMKKIQYYCTMFWSDIQKRHQPHPHGFLRDGQKCQISYECQILVPVDMNIVLL